MVRITSKMRHHQSRIGILCLASTVLLSSVVAVQARSLDGYTQGLPKASQQTVTLTPKALTEGSSDNTVLVSELKGVVVVTAPDDVREAGVSQQGIVSDPDLIPPAVAAAAQRYVGKPISLANLDEMTRDMVLAFRAAGRPVVNVVVPPQDITAGSVQVIAVVGRMGELTVEGNVEDPGYYKEDFPLASGDVITEGDLLDYLRWKSRRANRSATAIYAPGSSYSLTNIAIDADETKPWSVFAGVDNTGNETVGDYRFFGGFILSNLWNLDHEFSYQFTTSEESIEALGAHVVSYTLPVPYLRRTDLNILASYVESESQSILTQNGESYQVSANFLTQLPRWNNVAFDARYGFEYKRSNSDLEFGGNTVSSTDTEIGQFYAQLLAQKHWSWGITNANIGVWASPGNLFADNDTATFQLSRSGASADYAIFRAGLEQTVNLPKNFLFTLDVEGQLATERLLSSELMYLGGMRSVRGFGENVAKGDEGILARAELITPGMSLLAKYEKLSDQLRAFAFLDAGAVSIKGGSVAGFDNASIAGAGLGLKYQIANHLDVEMSYGWNIYDDSNVEEDDGAVNFRLVVRY